MTILPSIATSLRKKYNKWLFMSRRPNQNRPVPNSSTDQGGGKRRGEGIGEITTKQKPSGVFAGRDNAKFTAMSALPPKADIRQRDCDVRFVPKADIDTC
jgi:hypothetical protein